jgi:hypothetical protein
VQFLKVIQKVIILNSAEICTQIFLLLDLSHCLYQRLSLGMVGVPEIPAPSFFSAKISQYNPVTVSDVSTLWINSPCQANIRIILLFKL